MLFLLSNDENRTVYHQRTYLFTAVFDFEFIFGVCLLKVILLNTDTFKSYFRGKSIDLVIVQKTAYSVNVVLKWCQNESSFNLIWKKCKKVSTVISKKVKDTPFTVKDLLSQRFKSSRRVQSLIHENSSRSEAQPPKSYHRIFYYYKSLGMVIEETSCRFEENSREKLIALSDVIFNPLSNESISSKDNSHHKVDEGILKCDKSIFASYKNCLEIWKEVGIWSCI